MRSDSYIQWYNENEGRKYPLSETATGEATLGTYLPDDIIVDIGVLVPPQHQEVYLSSVRMTATLVTVSLRSPLSGLLLGTYARAAIQAYKAYPLSAIVDDVSGWIVFGNHRVQGVEDYRFSLPEQSLLEPRVVHVVDTLPVVRFVRHGGSAAFYADGVVSLEGAAGVSIKRDSVDPQKVIVRLEGGLQTAMAGPCNEVASSNACKVPPVRSISGVCPTAEGVLTLRFE